MLHEIGHLHYRHSLRMAIQGFSLAIIITAVTGDVSAGSSIITSLPAILIESGYSREMETEADTYALLYMLQHNINPNNFASMMRKLELSHTHTYIKCMQNDNAMKVCLNEVIQAGKQENVEEDYPGGYFSSHPGSQERILKFEAASTRHN